MLRVWQEKTRSTQSVDVWDSASTANTRDASTPPADQLFIVVDSPTPTPVFPNIHGCRFFSVPATRQRVSVVL